jgi:hypothetical protein
MATVTYDHVTKKFDDTAAVQDLTLQVADGGDTHVGKDFLRRFADTRDLPHRKREEELLDLVGTDDEQAVGLAPVGCDLRQKFVWGDAGGGGEARFFANLAADLLGGFSRGLDAGQFFRDVEIGLVE